MAGSLLDWIMGAGPLKQAAATGGMPAPIPQPSSQPQVIDMASEAAKMAPKPAATPAAPAPALKKKKKPIDPAAQIGNNMKQAGQDD